MVAEMFKFPGRKKGNRKRTQGKGIEAKERRRGRGKRERLRDRIEWYTGKKKKVGKKK